MPKPKKKLKSPVNDLMAKDFDLKPIYEGTKKAVELFLPSLNKSVAREQKKLLALKQQLKIKKLQLEQKRLLKELEETN